MRGQTAPEALILISVILLTVASLVYVGSTGNDSSVIFAVVRDGAENILARIDFDYGCSSQIENLSVVDSVRIGVVVRNAPPQGLSWENFRDNILLKGLEENLPDYIARYAGRSYTVEATARRVEK